MAKTEKKDRKPREPREVLCFLMPTLNAVGSHDGPLYEQLGPPHPSTKSAKVWLRERAGDLNGAQVIIAACLKPLTVSVEQVQKVTLG